MKTISVSKLIVAAATAATFASSAAGAQDKPAEKEKCYGVAKAGKNDCASGAVSCAGSSKTDGQGDAYVVVPKGLCDKLVGGSTSAKS